MNCRIVQYLGELMRVLTSIIAVTICTLMFNSGSARASETVLTGVGIGAASGLVVAGPPGAVVGGILGGLVRGPRISYGPQRWCWTGAYGRRCTYR